MGWGGYLCARRGRRVLGVLALVGGVAVVVLGNPVRTISPGEAAVRVNRVTGGVTVLGEGWAMVIPVVHEFRRYPLRDQIYRPPGAEYQSVEGLTLGVDVSVRYALDPAHMTSVARLSPNDVTIELVSPAVDGVLHRTFAQHTVREIFAQKRAEIQASLQAELAALLAPDGIVVRATFIGNVDLPSQYKNGLESLLAEELSAEKMRYTLELKQQDIKRSELEAEADKVRRQKAAEAAGAEEIIAAKSKAEAMQHILPFREKEIEEKRLEAEAAKVTRLKAAEADAEARRIEAQGEADSRRKLAESDAYRLEITGKANAEQMAREAALIQKNPLLIQKAIADKLSDKIQVIIAPPQVGGFFAQGILGAPAAQAQAPAPNGDE